MYIAHNLLSANAERMYRINTEKRDKSLNRLGSGYRINRAADDAAGLSISEKMRSQIRGLGKGAQNLQDGIDYVQVADGALAEVNEMLIRIRELAIQSSNDTNTPEDRAKLEQEVKQLKLEMQRIFTDTEFNTIKIWDDRGSKRVLQEVIRGDEVEVPTVKFSKQSVSFPLDNTNREAIPRGNYFYLKADDNGIRVNWTGYNGKSYNSDYVPWKSEIGGKYTIDLEKLMANSGLPEVAGIKMKMTLDVNEHASLAEAKKAIDNTSIYAYESHSTPTVQMGGSTVQGISGSITLNYDALLVAKSNLENGDDPVFEWDPVGGSNVIVNPANGTSSDQFKFAYQMRNIGGVKTELASVDYFSSDRDDSAENVWWYWYTSSSGTKTRIQKAYIPTPPDASLDAINSAIPSLSGTTHGKGGTVRMTFNLMADNPYTRVDGAAAPSRNVGTMTFSVSVPAGSTESDIKTKLQNLKGFDASVSGGTAKMTVSSGNSNSSQKTKYNKPDTEIWGYETELHRNIHIQAGANSYQEIPLEYEALRLETLGLWNTKIDSYESAQKAIDEIDAAQQTVSEQRALFGAYMNRMEHAYDNNKNAEENLQASESRIRDADMADESVGFAKQSILMQVGEAMITQANQSKEGVLNLIRS